MPNIPLNGAPGDLFPRLGKLGLLVKATYAFQQSQLINMTDTTNGVVAQFNAESDLQALMGSSYIGILSGVEGACTTAQNLAQQTLNRMVFRSAPQLSQTLQSLNLTASLNELIRQMDVAGATVLALTVTATPSSFTGVGNGILVASVKRPSDGRVCENSFPETVNLTVTADSYSGAAVAGNESLSATGAGNQTDVFAFNWPLGSNCQTSLSAIDGNSDNSAGNLLTNSGFEIFTVADTPDNWVIVAGTAGTNIFKESTIVYDGAASLLFTGDGAVQQEITQLFDDSTGTLGTLSDVTQYAFNIFVRRSGTAITTGTLTISLIDQDGNIILDAAGVPNSLAIDCTALTTQFAAYNICFRTPVVMPTTVRLDLAFTTPLSAGASVYIDKAALGGVQQLYTSGPSLAVFAGSIPFADGDYATCAVTNSFGAGGTLSTWQLVFNQFFGCQALDLLLPSSATPTISDSLIS